MKNSTQEVDQEERIPETTTGLEALSLTPDEAGRILALASAYDSENPSLTKYKDLERAAEEAGIDPRYVKRAAHYLMIHQEKAVPLSKEERKVRKKEEREIGGKISGFSFGGGLISYPIVAVGSYLGLNNLLDLPQEPSGAIAVVGGFLITAGLAVIGGIYFENRAIERYRATRNLERDRNIP